MEGVVSKAKNFTSIASNWALRGGKDREEWFTIKTDRGQFAFETEQDLIQYVSLLTRKQSADVGRNIRRSLKSPERKVYGYEVNKVVLGSELNKTGEKVVNNGDDGFLKKVGGSNKYKRYSIEGSHFYFEGDATYVANQLVSNKLTLSSNKVSNVAIAIRQAAVRDGKYLTYDVKMVGHKSSEISDGESKTFKQTKPAQDTKEVNKTSTSLLSRLKAFLKKATLG